MNKEVCKNCEKSYLRSSFDLKKYGNRHCPYECSLVIDRVKYRRADDTCPLFKKGDKNVN